MGRISTRALLIFGWNWIIRRIRQNFGLKLKNRSPIHARPIYRPTQNSPITQNHTQLLDLQDWLQDSPRSQIIQWVVRTVLKASPLEASNILCKSRKTKWMADRTGGPVLIWVSTLLWSAISPYMVTNCTGKGPRKLQLMDRKKKTLKGTWCIYTGLCYVSDVHGN